MKALIIDTTLDTSYIILIENYEIIVYKKFEKLNLSKELFLNLKNILNKTNTNLSDLEYIATSIGPGSFTGLRVGASICKTISYAKKIPLISYISLKAYSPNIEGPFLVTIDAKSQGVFIIEAKLKKDTVEYTSDVKLYTPDEAILLFNNYPLILSPDADVLKEKFENNQNKFLKHQINPHKLVDLTNQIYINKEFEDYNSFDLLYLRGPNHTLAQS